MSLKVEIYRAGNFYQISGNSRVISSGSTPQHAALNRLLIAKAKRAGTAINFAGDLVTFIVN